MKNKNWIHPLLMLKRLQVKIELVNFEDLGKALAMKAYIK